MGNTLLLLSSSVSILVVTRSGPTRRMSYKTHLLAYLLTYLLTRRARVCDLKASATLSVMEMTVYIHPIQQSCKLAVEADPCVCLRGI